MTEPIRFKEHTAEQLHPLLAPLGVDARLARRLQSAVLRGGAALWRFERTFQALAGWVTAGTMGLVVGIAFSANLVALRRPKGGE